MPLCCTFTAGRTYKIQIQFLPGKRGTSIQAYIEIPEDYPRAYISYLKQQKKTSLGSLSAFYYPTGRQNTKYLKVIGPLIWISSFYLWHRENQDAGLPPRETKELRGIGEFMLRGTMRRFTCPFNTMLSLEASGGYAYVNPFQDMGPATLRREVQKRGLTIAQYIELKQIEYNELLAEKSYTTEVQEALREDLYVYLGLEQLVSYYARYGFTKRTYDHKHYFSYCAVPLVTTIHQIRNPEKC